MKKIRNYNQRIREEIDVIVGRRRPDQHTRPLIVNGSAYRAARTVGDDSNRPLGNKRSQLEDNNRIFAEGERLKRDMINEQKAHELLKVLQAREYDESIFERKEGDDAVAEMDSPEDVIWARVVRYLKNNPQTLMDVITGSYDLKLREQALEKTPVGSTILNVKTDTGYINSQGRRKQGDRGAMVSSDCYIHLGEKDERKTARFEKHFVTQLFPPLASQRP